MHVTAGPPTPKPNRPSTHGLTTTSASASYVHILRQAPNIERTPIAEYKRLIGVKILCWAALAAVREFVVEALSSELHEARVYHCSRAGSVLGDHGRAKVLHRVEGFRGLSGHRGEV
ncbi:hypothetical protein LTS09_012704 [Friedmanniomyces endolithicus]|nr:hypothetical protein LTS09_012704 [Friedmanniomyces endolithicus]